MMRQWQAPQQLEVDFEDEADPRAVAWRAQMAAMPRETLLSTPSVPVCAHFAALGLLLSVLTRCPKHWQPSPLAA